MGAGATRRTTRWRTGPRARSDATSTARIRQFAPKPTSRKIPLSLYPEVTYEGYSWASIDLNACTGCGAAWWPARRKKHCGVGKTEVMIGRGDALDFASIATTKGTRQPNTYHDHYSVCIVRTRRAKLSVRGGDGSQPGRPERNGLQPLRGHAVLLEQPVLIKCGSFNSALLGLG